MSASAGRVLIKPRGVYNPATPYEILDSVFYNGSSYICINDTLGHAPTDSGYWQIFAQGAGVISGAFAGACDSLGSAQVKSVIIPPADNFALQKGVIVGVRFTNTNTFEATSENSIALNVNNTGALPIYFDGTATPLGDNVVAFGEAAYTHFYQYDGSNWVFIGRSGVQTAEQTPYDSTKSTKAVIDELADKLVTTSETVTGNPLSFTTDSAQPSQNTVITFEPIQSGSGDPSPSNVRAISGFDEIDLAVPRENQWDEKWEQGYFTDSGVPASNVDTIRSKNYIGVLPNTTYYFKSPSIVSLVIKYVFYDSNKNILSVAIDQSSSQAFTTPNNAKYMRFSTNIRYGGTYNYDISINYPSTDISYHAYNPITNITLELDSTIYGGTLDVESGELVVDKGFKMYNGSENWEQSANPNACKIPIPSDMDANDPDAICDTYTYTTTPNEVNYGFAIGQYITVKDVANCSTVADFKTYLSGHNITFVYKLKNPITYHLNPNQVRLLQGANVVTSNGTSLSLTYRNGEVATLEDLDGLAESINGASESIKHLNDTETIISGSNILLMRTGNVVSLILNGASTGPNGNGLVLINGENLVIPSKYRPKADTYAGVIAKDSSNQYRACYVAVGASNGQATIMYPNGGSVGRVDNGTVFGSTSWII